MQGKRSNQILALGMATWLALGGQTPLAYATGTDNVSYASDACGQSKTFESCCNGVPTGDQVRRMQALDPNVNINPRWEYCDAARAARSAKEKNEILMGVWIGVASVCSAMCIAGFTGNGVPIVCQSANIVGGVTDVAVTGELVGLMGSLGSATIAMTTSASAPGGLLGVADPNRGNSNSEGGADASADAGESSGSENSSESQGANDIGACLTALTAAGTALQKGMSLDGFNRTVQTSVTEAAKLDPAANGQLVRNGDGSFNINDHSARRNTSAGNREMGGTAGGGTSGGSNPTPADCAGVQPGAVHSAIASCALALDSTLPSGVGGSDFQNALQNRLGQDLSGLSRLAAENPVNDVVAQAMGAGMAPKTQAALAGIVNDLAGKVAPGVGVGSYAGGGGRRSGGGGGADPFGGALAGLMEQLMPKKPGAKDADPHAGVKRVAAAMQTRGPASVSDDPSLGIFDRISYRYYSLAYQGFGKAEAVPARATAVAAPTRTFPTLPSARLPSARGTTR